MERSVSVGVGGASERKRARSSANVRSAPAGPRGSGPARVTRLECCVTLMPSTLTTLCVPSPSSLEIAQREANPSLWPTSAANLVASVESRVTAFLNACKGKPAFFRAASTTWREPEPCSRINSVAFTNSVPENLSNVVPGGAMSTSSSRGDCALTFAGRRHGIAEGECVGRGELSWSARPYPDCGGWISALVAVPSLSGGSRTCAVWEIRAAGHPQD